MMTFIDPGSYGKSSMLKDQTGADSLTVENPDLIEFRYDMTKSLAARVQASRYNCTVDANGVVTKGDRKQVEVSSNVINTMLDQLMDQLIIVIPDKSMTLEDYVAQGYHYFKTKGGSMIRATRGSDGRLAFEGGWQIEHNHKTITNTEVYPKVNGQSYQLESGVPLGAQKSLYITLKEHQEYQDFLNLLENDYTELLIQKLSNKYNVGLQAQANKNLRLFDNYNYTVYVPTNSSIEQLQQEGKMPAFDDLDMGDDEENLDNLCRSNGWYDLGIDEQKVRTTVESTVKSIITEFLRYHVQDHSVAVGMAKDPSSEGKYESMKRNPETGRFYPLAVDYDTQSMTVTDVMGNQRHVVATEGLFNNICREYWFEGSGNSARLFMGSDIVVHLIDGPLHYEQMRPWKDVVSEALEALK